LIVLQNSIKLFWISNLG
jgi:hypothetical protein